MPLTPALPTSWVKWAKYVIKGVEWSGPVIAALVDQSATASHQADVQWRYVVGRVLRPTPVGTTEDYAQFGFNLVNITSGDIDTSWTSGDYTAMEGFLATWWTTVKPKIEADHQLIDWRWYRRSFADPMTAAKRFATNGPPDHVTVVASAGTKIAALNPPQVAMSVTLRTAAPKHWGRFYLPGLSNASIDGYGRWVTADAQAIATATSHMFDQAQGAGFMPVVPITQVDSVIVPGLLGVTQVVVDDIPDIIRRRRPRQAKVRSIGVVP